VLFVTIWQSLAQIEASYGRDADTILTNHLTKVFYAGVSDPASLRYVAQVLGDAEVETRSHSLPEALGRASTQLSTTRTALAPTRYARCNPATACSCTAPSHPRTSAPTPTTATAASPTAPPSHPQPPLPAARHPYAMTRSRRRSPAASSCTS
jgi:hypothetical protein